MTASVDGFPVASRTSRGYLAFQNLGPHEAHTRAPPFGGGPLGGCIITCPQHSSKYDVRNGDCVQPDTADGFYQALRVFATRVVEASRTDEPSSSTGVPPAPIGATAPVRPQKG
jgi:nitrite reductase/ring-hydroxylating ferredoxin subunit